MELRVEPFQARSFPWRTAALILLAGVLLRVLARTAGFGSDVISWERVARIMADGDVVYAETKWYNYGPVWFSVLDVLRRITEWMPWPAPALRLSITSTLILADATIYCLLARFLSFRIAVLFFLNPLSIVVTGYLGQFDNLALLIGLGAVLLYPQENDAPLGRRKLAALGLLGLSLMTKHVLFLLPLWLALKEKKPRRALVVLGMPVAVFLGGFVPYWHKGKEGIIQHVFLYRSSGESPFWDFLGAPAAAMAPKFVLFMGTLAVLGIILRKRSPLESFFFYCGSMYLFTPSIYAHYQAIPVLFLAAYMNPPLALFNLIVGWAACVGFLAPESFDTLIPRRIYREPIETVLLLAGFLWALAVPPVWEGGFRLYLRKMLKRNR